MSVVTEETPAVEAEQEPQEPTEAPQEPTEPTTEEPEPQEPEEPQTFPREYVQKLRDESAKYRQRASKADDLAKRLHTALVAASGRLQDASDLPFDESHLEAPDALTGAIDTLLASKPHLASRKPTGTIPQGATAPAATVSLSTILRRNAGS